MGVVGLAYEMPDSPTGGEDKEGKATFTRKFLVETNSYGDGPITVGSAIGLPFIGTFYITANDVHPFAFCTSREFERVEPNSLLWVATCKYETPDPDELEQEDRENDDPLFELPEVELDFESSDIPVTFTYDDQGQLKKGALANSAGDTFDPPFTRPVAIAVLTITRNEPIDAPHPLLAVTYLNTCNQDSFWGTAPGQCLMAGIKVSRKTKTTKAKTIIPYLSVTYTVKVKDTWDIEALDIGPHYMRSIGEGEEKKHAFIDNTGHPFNGLLDGNGHALHFPIDEPVTEPEVFLPKKKIYARLPFGALNLPQSFVDLSA